MVASYAQPASTLSQVTLFDGEEDHTGNQSTDTLVNESEVPLIYAGSDKSQYPPSIKRTRPWAMRRPFWLLIGSLTVIAVCTAHLALAV